MGLLELLQDSARAVKDAGLAQGLREWANLNLDFGKVRELKLDTRARRIDLVLGLKGEADPVSISLCDYRVSRDDTGLVVAVGTVATSREWLTILAQKTLAQKTFRLPIPKGYEWLVEMLA